MKIFVVWSMDRYWYEIVDEIEEAETIGLGLMEAIIAVLEDKDWERLLVLMKDADDFA